MKEKKLTQVQKQYRFDKESNTYLIEVSLDSYDDVYDEWDPSPFKRRFIEEGFDSFIVSSSEDIPLKYKLSIVLHIPEQKKDSNKEISVMAAYKNYYAYALEKIGKNRTQLRKKNMTYISLSILFLTIGYFFEFGDGSVILSVINEGVFIGGWVFLWEFFTNIIITRGELNDHYKLYERLYLSEIKFVYA